MVPIGTEIARTELVFHPAYLERVDYLAVTYECPSCKDSPEPQLVKDEGAAALVPHSYVSSGLAAHVMYWKFINALSYYRQEKNFENQFEVKIGCGTMAHWTIYCAENYFSLMIGVFHRQLLKRKYAATKFFEGSQPSTYINVDGYAGYNKLKDFKRCCCYAHIRRYFLAAVPKGKEKTSRYITTVSRIKNLL